MPEFPYCKLEIYIPESHLEPLREALRRADAGHIGNYDCCLSYSRVTSCWRPLAGTSPYLGAEGKISVEPTLMELSSDSFSIPFRRMIVFLQIL